jgi:hypothetical protein
MEGTTRPKHGDSDEHHNANSHVPSLSELSQRLHCPVDYKTVLPISVNMTKHPETSLSYIPWRLQQIHADGTSKDDAFENLDGNKNGTMTNDTTHEDQPQHIFFPSYSYLDLRRQQNNSWASERHKEGMQQFFINPTKAETKFLEGLDLVPDHVDLLADYGKLLISNNDFVAAEAKLKRALDLDPNHKLAKDQLDRLEQRQRRTQQHQGRLLNRKIKVARESSAYNDVLMERALAMEDNPEEDGEEYASKNKKRSHRDRKHSKRKKKRRRRRRYYSSSSASSDSSSVSSSDGHDYDASSRDEEGAADAAAHASDDDDDSRQQRKKRKDRKRRKRSERKHHSKTKKKKRKRDH